jgi:hypothetical protein
MVRRRWCNSLFLLPFSFFLLSACERPPRTPDIQLNPQFHTVDVTGLSATTLRTLSEGTLTIEEWQGVLRVSVGAEAPAVAGKYAVVDGALRFTPLFPLDEGRQYTVAFNPSRVPGQPGRESPITLVVGRPASGRVPSTVVTRVYPSADIVPANQLRLYLHFSAPMDWRSGYDYLQLLDERGEEVVDAFLPLDADFWNHDRTRYTVFFDPGRVKRGILPNKQMGRALEAGRRYTLVVKRDWRDGHGLPLKDEFRHEFRASVAIERPLTTAAWKVSAPRAGSREPLSVSFPEPLDYGLLQRALNVVRDGKPVDGEISIEPGETRWVFTPRDAWAPGEYQVVALAFLEDLAGNRIGRAFEVDNFERTDITSEPERTTVPFRVGPGT